MLSYDFIDSGGITAETMAVIAEINEAGEVYSKIVEAEKEYAVNEKPLTVIDQGCRYFGSSLKGRQDGTKEIAGITHKAPVAIDPASGIYMFPTLSPYKEGCSWISHSFIQRITAVNNHQTKIVFTNKREVIVNVSKATIEKQLYRTAHFRFLLSERIRVVLESR